MQNDYTQPRQDPKADPLLNFRDKFNQMVMLMRSSRKIPMSRMVMVNADTLVDMADDLDKCLAQAFDEAFQIVSRQNGIIEDAKSKASAITAKAQEDDTRIRGELEQQKQAVTAHLEKQKQDALASIQQQTSAQLQETQQKVANMIRDAQEQRTRILSDAEHQAAQMVSEQEIVARANLEAQDMKNAAEQDIRKLYSDVYGSIDGMLVELDHSFSEKLEQIRYMHQQIHQND